MGDTHDGRLDHLNKLEHRSLDHRATAEMRGGPNAVIAPVDVVKFGNPRWIAFSARAGACWSVCQYRVTSPSADLLVASTPAVRGVRVEGTDL